MKKKLKVLFALLLSVMLLSTNLISAAAAVEDPAAAKQQKQDTGEEQRTENLEKPENTGEGDVDSDVEETLDGEEEQTEESKEQKTVDSSEGQTEKTATEEEFHKEKNTQTENSSGAGSAGGQKVKSEQAPDGINPEKDTLNAKAQDQQVESQNTRIQTGVTSSTEDSLTWPGQGTQADPRVKSVSTSKDVLKVMTADTFATINGSTGLYSRLLNFGENQFDLKVVARDQKTTTWYRLFVTREKRAQNDYPYKEKFYITAASTADSADGKIRGFEPNKRYDYKLTSDTEWTPLPEGVTEASGLKAGEYQIRYGETAEFKPGLNSVRVTLPVAQKKTLRLDSKLQTMLESSGIQVQLPAEANAGELVTVEANVPESILIQGLDWTEDRTGDWLVSQTATGTQTMEKTDTGYFLTYSFIMPSYNILIKNIKMATGEWYQVSLDESQKWDFNIKVTGSETTTQNNVSFYKKDSQVEITLTAVEPASYQMKKISVYDTRNQPIASADGGSITINQITDNLIVKGERELIPADFTKLDEAMSNLPEDLEMLTDASKTEIYGILATEPNVRKLGKGNQAFVDDYVKGLLDAIGRMEFRDADLSKLRAAIDSIPSDLGIYTDETAKAVEDAKTAAQVPIDENWDIREQTEVDRLTKDLEDAVAALVKKPAAMPKAPELQAKTDTQISVKEEAGLEYSIDGGKTWQSSGTFTGLSPYTEYQIAARVKETATAGASPASKALTVMTDKAEAEVPRKPQLVSVTSSSIKVKEVKGQEYSIDGGKTWQSSGTFTGLTAGKAYEIVTRVAETDTSKASENSDPLKVTTKTTKGAPKTNKSVPSPSTAKSKTVKTGDETNVLLLILLLTVSGMGVTVLTVCRKRKKY